MEGNVRPILHMLMSRIRTTLKILIIIVAGALITQTLCFAYVLTRSPELAPADVIVVFEGQVGRTQTAYALADQGYAPNVIISPASKQRLKRFDRRFKPKRTFNRIIEDKARTTFENALLTGKLIERNQFGSVILVTQWSHMPRSYLLLKTMLLGANTRIEPCPVPTGKLKQENWYHHTVGWKMVYNEMVEIWGSLIEHIRYKITGELPPDRIGKSSMIRKLKAHLLFKIHPEELSLPKKNDKGH